jgi:hypothetical protein
MGFDFSMCFVTMVMCISNLALHFENRRLRRRNSTHHEARMELGRELIASLNAQTRLANELTAERVRVASMLREKIAGDVSGTLP